MSSKIKIKEDDLHAHIKARMRQRGVLIEEIEKTLNEGWNADDTKQNIIGKVFIFPYNTLWEEKFFEEKEVTVYYKYKAGQLVLLTVKARYGTKFPRKE